VPINHWGWPIKKGTAKDKEERTVKTKIWLKFFKATGKFKDITFYEEEDDSELIQCKKDIISYNRALNEFKNGEAVSIDEYLKSRKIDV